jgi:dTDP-4-dehydrorhamnose reductase
MKKVLVVGGTGMLGGMVADVLSRQKGIELAVTARDTRWLAAAQARLSEARWIEWDVEREHDAGTLPDGRCDWVVNCVGVIKPFIKDDDAAQVARAVRVNSLFPHRLAAMARTAGARVLQIATDCVYSGKDGSYPEDAPHDALDVYGKSKSLGEVTADGFHNLRCSIIGPEPKGRVSLLEWFLKQPRGASVTGFLNHSWNGVTTLHFAKISAGVILRDLALPVRQHLVPSGELSKADMLSSFAKAYGRGDITINRAEAATLIDRTLSTKRPDLSTMLWDAAGYAAPLTVPEMIAELGAFDFRLWNLESGSRGESL